MEDAVTSPAGIAILDVENEAWPAFVDGHPDATPFHHPAWSQLLADCYRLRPRVAAVLDGAGAIVAGLPLIEVGRGSRSRWVSLPFTDRCAPLVRTDAGAPMLAERLEHMRRELRLRSVEVRDRLADESGWVVPRGYWHELPLMPEPDELRAGLHTLRVRLLRRAAREGVVVERGGSKRDLCEVFYGLHVATRRRLGVPVQPRRFFELLWDRMLERQLGFVLIARKGTAPIAAAVFLANNGRVTYKFSASDSRYVRLGGSTAVLWEAIRSSCRNGDRVLDFGRTEADNPGLRAFKLGWGAHEEPLDYTVLAASAPSTGKGRGYDALRTVIRHSPSWVGRAMGAIAYRYTA
jgi:CelD/BcsL family acetyltransferase involved in cellulose biosynthesis